LSCLINTSRPCWFCGFLSSICISVFCFLSCWQHQASICVYKESEALLHPMLCFTFRSIFILVYVFVVFFIDVGVVFIHIIIHLFLYYSRNFCFSSDVTDDTFRLTGASTYSLFISDESCAADWII
jgi:hypothetical protein